MNVEIKGLIEVVCSEFTEVGLGEQIQRIRLLSKRMHVLS